MFKQIKKTDIVLVIILILLVSVFGYYYANLPARNHLWQEAYPIRTAVSSRHWQCSSGSPEWMQAIIRYQVTSNNAPSNQIAYIDTSGKLYHCEIGDKEEYPLISDPITADTRFRYASVTKLWTADAILALVREGRLSLDTKLASILNEINNPKDPRINDITIGELLSHRAGFDRTSVFGNDMFGIGSQFCPNNLAHLNEIELTHNPNETMSYSNLGYCLLGEVISRINSQPYTQVIEQQYHLNDSSIRFINNTEMPDEVFYNYNEEGLTGFANIFTAFDYTALASSAGLSGDASDLAIQVRAMAQKPAPNIKSLDATLQCDMDILRDCYGYAMFPYQPNQKSPRVFYRDGTLLGLASLVVVTEDNQVVALLSNGTANNKTEGADQVKQMIYHAISKES